MARRIRTVGNIEPELLQLIIDAGYDVEQHIDPLDIKATDIEGLAPTVLSDVGRHTARGIVKGLQRDVQATQRFFLIDPTRSEDVGESVESGQELWVLTEFTHTVSRTLAKSEIVDGAVRFLGNQVMASTAVHYWSSDDGKPTMERAAGFTNPQLKLLSEYLIKYVDPNSTGFRRGIDFRRSPDIKNPPFRVTAIVPILAKDELLGILTLALSPSLDLSMNTVKAMARQLGLSLHNGELLERTSKALESLKRVQQSMTQSEKLAAVGVLAAGIAHEINNPTSFIITNLTVLSEYIDDLLGYAKELEKRLSTDAEPEEEDVQAVRERFDIDYISNDLPALIERSQKGMLRIRDIVQDLKSFAHRDDSRADWVDVNHLITQVLKLAGAELRHRARVELDLRPVPNIFISSTRLLQVLLNLIINAYQAFGDRPPEKNVVWVGSTRDGDRLCLFVADNGCGIPQDRLDHIFEPFFTTKPIGTGTGLGLAISYEIIKKMGGKIRVSSTEGRGTRFEIEFNLSNEDDDGGLKWREETS